MPFDARHLNIGMSCCRIMVGRVALSFVASHYYALCRLSRRVVMCRFECRVVLSGGVSYVAAHDVLFGYRIPEDGVK